jgi:hypothetical protein
MYLKFDNLYHYYLIIATLDQAIVIFHLNYCNNSLVLPPTLVPIKSVLNTQVRVIFFKKNHVTPLLPPMLFHSKAKATILTMVLRPDSTH